MKRLFVLFTCFLLLQAQVSYSQLTVTTNSVATALAQTITGSGVTVSNATLNCAQYGAGTFTYSGSNLGLTNGIILTTGAAADAAHAGAYFCDTITSITGVSDPDLNTITSGNLNDLCFLAFDFTPICSNLSVTFVFGSEEYNGYVGSSYNDAFGIFLTGPNPSGGTYSSQNVAVLPNGTPVSINNVNNGNNGFPSWPPTNPQYYIDNIASPNNDIAYDGYTTPITAITSVVPCSTYHIKIAIADVGDESYDSGVFIQGNSVSCTNTPSITVSTAPANCGNVGSASVTVTNYTGTPTYQWSPGGQTTSSINNLSAGTYSCMVSYASACGTTTQTVTAVVGSSINSPTLTVTPTNPSCNGSSDGGALLTISGGTAPFTYTWSTNPIQNTLTATNLPAGTYTVSVTDSNNCISSAIASLTDPPPIIPTLSTSPTICTGSVGSATASIVSGGTAPYTYTWLTNPVQGGATISGLAQGQYTVIITDVNGCPATDTATVFSTGFTWVPVISPTPALCKGSANGSATVTINNPGAGFYTYTWTPSAQTSSVATGLTAGNYTVTVKDNNACIASASVTITQPTQLLSSAQSNPANCTANNGSATVIASGGTSPYTYLWQPANQITATASNLNTGTYSITVNDANGCAITQAVYVRDTTDLTVRASFVPDICNSGIGKAIANPSGAYPYTYLWNDSKSQTNWTADSLHADTYLVTVTDAYGCIASTSVTVTNQNEILHSQLSIQPEGEIDAEDPYTLQVLMNGGWQIDSSFLSNGTIIDKNPFPYVFPKYGEYYATYYFESTHGCKDTVTYPILVKDYITLYIPNAFTPNGDGQNDVFAAVGSFVNSFEMYIYDRWGDLVIKLDNINKYWDGSRHGSMAPADIYVYKGTASDIFGKRVNFHGQINLIR